MSVVEKPNLVLFAAAAEEGVGKGPVPAAKDEGTTIAPAYEIIWI